MKQAVCALIFNDEGKVLCVSRKDDHNDFGLPGGKVDAGEDFWQALVREVKEETGLDIEYVAYVTTELDGEYIVPTYLCTVNGDIDKLLADAKLDPKETGVIKWMTWDELCSQGSFKDYNNRLRKILNV